MGILFFGLIFLLFRYPAFTILVIAMICSMF